MQVPFIDLKSQYHSIKEEVQKEINEVLDSTSYILGKKVLNFESCFADAHDVKHCIGVSSGTDGNHLCLWAIGIKPGDEIILPANTFIATAWGVTLCGAKPVFVDCEKDSYNLDPAKLEETITPYTKAIIAVHLYGQPADMDPIKKIAREKNILLIEDAAQAHLAEYKGVKVGGIGASASFSFYPGKNLGAYGEAGAVTTNDADLAKKIRMMRDHGSEKKYYHEIFGHNYRMEGIQGAVLNVKLKYLSQWTELRRNAADKYREYLKDIDELILPVEMSYAKHVYHLFVIQTEKRDALQKYFSENGISTGLHYPIPLHLQKCFENLGYKKGDFPVTEKLSDYCLSLPIFPEISDSQIQFVCDHIKEFYTKA